MERILISILFFIGFISALQFSEAQYSKLITVDVDNNTIGTLDPENGMFTYYANFPSELKLTNVAYDKTNQIFYSLSTNSSDETEGNIYLVGVSLNTNEIVFTWSNISYNPNSLLTIDPTTSNLYFAVGVDNTSELNYLYVYNPNKGSVSLIGEFLQSPDSLGEQFFYDTVGEYLWMPSPGQLSIISTVNGEYIKKMNHTGFVCSSNSFSDDLRLIYGWCGSNRMNATMYQKLSVFDITSGKFIELATIPQPDRIGYGAIDANGYFYQFLNLQNPNIFGEYSWFLVIFDTTGELIDTITLYDIYSPTSSLFIY